MVGGVARVTEDLLILKNGNTEALNEFLACLSRVTPHCLDRRPRVGRALAAD